MEGFPSIKTIESYLPQGASDLDRYPQSSTVDFHNKADGHERRIALYLVENMQYTFEPFEQFIYCTQLMQAECLASAYRLWKRQWKGPGKEYCAGALVWQINDCWPVTSWAIADYYQRPKFAYYTVKRELQLLTIGLKRTVKESHVDGADLHSRADVQTTHHIEMWASNLTLEAHTVSVVLKSFDLVTGSELYAEDVVTDYILQPNRSSEITVFALPTASSDQDAHLRTVVAAYLMEDGRQVARYVNWPEPLKYAHLQKPQKLNVSVLAGRVEVSSDVPIKGVAVESVEDEEVEFEDNCLDMVPGETVSFKAAGLTDEKKHIRVRFLNMNSGPSA